MSQPPIIGSGKPHTVSLKPGSSMAVSVPPRGPEESGTAGSGRLNSRLRPVTQADRTARSIPEEFPPVEAAAATPAAGPAHAATAPGLSAAILQRIQQLKQRNDAVGEALGTLPASGKAAR